MTTTITIIFWMSVIYAIACWIWYHKVVTVYYFNLGMGLSREIITSLVIGMALAFITVYYWWISCIILIIVAYSISSKCESRSMRQFIWIVFIILCAIVAFTGISIKRSVKENENEEARRLEYREKAQQKEAYMENNMYNVSAYFDGDSKIEFTKDNTVQLLKECKCDTENVTGEDDETLYVTLEQLLTDKMKNVEWESTEARKAYVTGTLMEGKWQDTDVKIIFQVENLSYYPEWDEWDLYAIWDGHSINDTESLFYSFVSTAEEVDDWPDDTYYDYNELDDMSEEDDIFNSMYEDGTEEIRNNPSIYGTYVYDNGTSLICTASIFPFTDDGNDNFQGDIIYIEAMGYGGHGYIDFTGILDRQPGGYYKAYCIDYDAELECVFEYQGVNIVVNASDHDTLYDIEGFYELKSSQNEPITFEESNDYIFYTSNSQYLTESDLMGLDALKCKLARNEIYARHGRKFTDAELQAYFDEKSWYHGWIEPNNFDDSVLNDYERANLDLIIQYESKMGYR